MKETRFDKTAFKAQSFAESDKSKLFDKSISLAQRLNMSFHLTCTIYGIADGPLKVDRTVFSARKF